MKTRDMIIIPIFTALIAVGAFIKIPIFIVPLTLQLMFTNLAALVLGSKKGAFASLLYLVIGLIGIPIFTKGGGFGYVFQPTFGYLVAFSIGAYFAGLIVEKSEKRTVVTYLLASAVNIIIVYSLGFGYGYYILNVYLAKAIPFKKLLSLFVLSPLPNDIFTLGITAFIAERLRKALR